MQKFLYICLFLFACAGASAQQMPERGQVRKGNRLYNKGEYKESVERYDRALALDPKSFEAGYNLGNALYKAEMFDKSEQVLQKVSADSLRSDEERAEAFYNLGNAQFQQKKYKEALASYRQSLRLNPSDMEAKYNYAYTKRLLDENKDGGGGDDQNKEKDQNKDQQQNGQNSDQQDQQGQPDEQPGDKNDGQEQQNPAQPEPGDEDNNAEQTPPQPQPGISEQEQEQMLDAIQAQEDKTQEKLKEKQGVIVRGKKNW